MGMSFKLWSFGYDLDNMKARCWYESRMPLHLVDERIREDYETHIAQIVKTAHMVQSTLHGCVKDAWYRGKPKSGEIAVVSRRFWSETEQYFYETLEQLATALLDGVDPSVAKEAWLRRVNRHSLEQIFDFYAQSQYVGEYDPKKIVTARKNLIKFTHPNSKKIAATLGLSGGAGTAKK